MIQKASPPASTLLAARLSQVKRRTGEPRYARSYTGTMLRWRTCHVYNNNHFMRWKSLSGHRSMTETAVPRSRSHTGSFRVWQLACTLSGDKFERTDAARVLLELTG